MSKVYGIKEDHGKLQLTEPQQGLGQARYFLLVTEKLKVLTGKRLTKPKFVIQLVKRGEQNQSLHTWEGDDRQTTLEKALEQSAEIIDARRGNKKK